LFSHIFKSYAGHSQKTVADSEQKNQKTPRRIRLAWFETELFSMGKKDNWGGIW